MNFGDKKAVAFYWLISMAGMTLSYMWYRLIRSYKDLNGAKFKVVHEIEAKICLLRHTMLNGKPLREERTQNYICRLHISRFLYHGYFSPFIPLFFLDVYHGGTL